MRPGDSNVWRRSPAEPHGLTGSLESIMTVDSLKTLEDDPLAGYAASGDTLALEVLLERHASTAVRIAYALLGNKEDAMDAAQTVLLQVAGDLPASWSGKS